MDVDLIIRLYNEGLSGDKISKELNIHRYYIYKTLNDNNVKMRNDREKSLKYSCNENTFEIIDSQEKAYWLGFLYADGYIRGKQKYTNRSLGLTLKSDDIGHIEKFKEFMKSNHNIKTYKHQTFDAYTSRILISSEKICSDLEKLGLVENKSLILKFPSENHVPKNLTNHFIRGYFDGDGSLKKTGSKHNPNTFCFSLLGTKEFLNKIIELYNLPYKIKLAKKETKTNSYQLTFSSMLYSIPLLDAIYNESTIHLQRKYDRYMMMKKYHEETKTK